MSSSSSWRAWRSGREGRWSHVAVVDTGCGCRPRRPRLQLMSLPSFLRPSPKPPVPRSSSSRSSSFFPSSASTASSSSAATYSSSNHFNCHPPPQQGQPVVAAAAAPHHETPYNPKAAARKRSSSRARKMAAAVEGGEEEDVGVAVEKESSDPRADFRESMTQMVVEMGLCDWDGLRCMLRRLLDLNAPRHHAAILTAFAEVCSQLA